MSNTSNLSQNILLARSNNVASKEACVFDAVDQLMNSHSASNGRNARTLGKLSHFIKFNVSYAIAKIQVLNLSFPHKHYKNKSNIFSNRDMVKQANDASAFIQARIDNNNFKNEMIKSYQGSSLRHNWKYEK